jgi:hypothetical protein
MLLQAAMPQLLVGLGAGQPARQFLVSQSRRQFLKKPGSTRLLDSFSQTNTLNHYVP